MKLKSKKSALLMSFTSLLLCFAMLAGSTFAWFTDTATTGVNKIVAGNLKVDIVDAANTDKSLTGEGGKLYWTQKVVGTTEEPVLEAVKNEGLPLWEPGVNFLTQGFKIANKGNLALKWKVEVNKGTTAANEKNADLLDVIDFSVVTDTGESATAVDIKTFVGELTEKNAVSTDTYYIKGHMQKEAGNDYQNLTLDGITITVYATQLNHENDSFGPDYDVTAPLDFVPVGTADELKSVFANAAAGEDVNVSLTGDIDLGTDKTLMIVDENSNVGDINIQANGHTIKNAVTGARVLQIAKSDATRNITISGAKIVSEGATTGKNAGENRGVQIFNVENATINLVNCEIEMSASDWSYPVKIGGTSKNITVNITGCTLTGANCIESFGANCIVNITDCVLNSNYVNSDPDQFGLGINDRGTNNTYNIKNTTFNGTQAQAKHSDTTNEIFKDLGGNVDNTTH